jgi:hypothetical protein
MAIRGWEFNAGATRRNTAALDRDLDSTKAIRP